MFLQNQRSLSESFDSRVLLETHRGLLSVREHKEETSIYDVDVVESNAMKVQRISGGLDDQRFVLTPVSALVEPSLGTVGAYTFTMSREEKSSGIGENRFRRQCLTQGGILSKEVHLGRGKRLAALSLIPALLWQCPSPRGLGGRI